MKLLQMIIFRLWQINVYLSADNIIHTSFTKACLTKHLLPANRKKVNNEANKSKTRLTL